MEGNQRASHITPTKAEAQAKGREMAQRLHTEHKIQNREGRITERNSYGRDPSGKRAGPRRSSGWTTSAQ